MDKVYLLNIMDRVKPKARKFYAGWEFSRGLIKFNYLFGRVRTGVDNLERLQGSYKPNILVLNHTGEFDSPFFLEKLNKKTTAWIKTKYYDVKGSFGGKNRYVDMLWDGLGAVISTILRTGGQVPITSKGHIINADYFSRTGRRLKEGYDVLSEAFDAYVNGEEIDMESLVQHREFFEKDGQGFSDSVMERLGVWDTSLREAHRKTLEWSLEMLQNGHNILIYPGGTRADRLPDQGYLGVAQLWWYFAQRGEDIRVVPVSIQGAEKSFKGFSMECLDRFKLGRKINSILKHVPFARRIKDTYMTQDGEEVDILYRVGESISLSMMSEGLVSTRIKGKLSFLQVPEDFVPFDPESEKKYGKDLEAIVGVFMDRINDISDEEYQSLSYLA